LINSSIKKNYRSKSFDLGATFSDFSSDASEGFEGLLVSDSMVGEVTTLIKSKIINLILDLVPFSGASPSLSGLKLFKREKIPYPSLQLKYRLPLAEPSFFPFFSLIKNCDYFKFF
jgi:hypothetical protein